MKQTVCLGYVDGYNNENNIYAFKKLMLLKANYYHRYL